MRNKTCNEEHIDEIVNRIDRLERLVLQIRGVRSVLAEEQINSCKLTFISPCYNEKENLQNLYTRILNSCEESGLDDFEIIWIENGSFDGSIESMMQLAEKDSRLRIIQLSRNYGYQGAITCGLAHARGEFVAILDGDLQDPPELIVKMLSIAENDGFDVVYGVRKKRKENIFKRFAYAAFYRLWKFTAEIEIPLDAGDYCVMRRQVVNAMNSMPERQRFTRGLRAWVGFKQTGFQYERDARAGGESKFGLSGMINLALDGLVAYSVAPLRMATIIGISVSGLAFALILIQGVGRLIAYALGSTFVGVLPPGISQTNLLMASLFGVQMLVVGVLGEYIGRIYVEVKDRPIFLIKDKIN
ncbi:glycosyltransferase family 2 protein [Sideroxyarcus emersonii]|nr:glycosyltransferase family 2 protein [Sideroxyarcus emersonii]